MKKFSVFLAAAALGALPLNAGAFGARAAGGHPAMAMGQPGMGLHGFNHPAFSPGFRGRGDGFAFRHDGRFHSHAFFRHERFFHHHHRFFRSDVVLVGFDFPYYPYYPYYYDPYYYYPDDGYPYGADGYGATGTDAYPSDLAASVQTELTRFGYYRGPIDGQLGPSTRRAIRAFQAARGLPVTGYVDPKFLSALERG